MYSSRIAQYTKFRPFASYIDVVTGIVGKESHSKNY